MASWTPSELSEYEETAARSSNENSADSSTVVFRPLEKTIMKEILRSILLLSFLISQAFSQTPSGTITGRITDIEGTAVTAATITIKNIATGFEALTRSGQDGRFVFKNVELGKYEIAFEAAGFEVQTTTVNISSTQSRTVDVRLEHSIDRAVEMPKLEKRSVPLASAAAPPEPDYGIVRIFYATDRSRSNRSSPANYYSGERGAEDRLSYGTCEVSIPRDHRMGVLEAPTIWRLQVSYDPEKHVTLLRVDEKDSDDFFSELRGRIASSNAKQAFVFIHGYNVSFEDASRRTAQLAYDLGFDGAPILYSWPSRACTSCYPADEASVDWTTAHLKNFLQEIAARSGASTVNLIAHSMGNRALTRALQTMASESQRGQLPFRQVILAAPDIDAGVFQQLAQAIQTTCTKVTLYASSGDIALSASTKFHQNPRAGQTRPKVVVVPGIDTIDASALDTGFLGHSYFAENTSILSDIIRLFRFGKSPGERCGMTPNPQTDPQYWVFDRAKALLCSVF